MRIDQREAIANALRDLKISMARKEVGEGGLPVIDAKWANRWGARVSTVLEDFLTATADVPAERQPSCTSCGEGPFESLKEWIEHRCPEKRQSAPFPGARTLSNI